MPHEMQNKSPRGQLNTSSVVPPTGWEASQGTHDSRNGCRNPQETIVKEPSSRPASPLPDRFKIITWNCRTLFGSTQGSSDQAKRVRSTHLMLKKMTATADIILLQESHGSEADLSSLRRHFLDFVFRGSFCDTHVSGGLVFAIRKKFLEKYGDPVLLAKVLRVRQVVPGRIAYITLPAVSGLTRLAVFNVHIDPGIQSSDPSHSNAKARMLYQLFGAVPTKTTTHSILAGDWNIVEADDPRFHPLDNKFVPDLTVHAKLLEAKLVGFTELHQPAYTRRQCAEGSISVLSRIDRIYSNWHTCELLDRHPLTSTFGLVTVLSSPSDHVPVLTCFSPPSTGPPEFPCIPVWVTKHAEFPGAVGRMWDCVKHLVLNPMERLGMAKSILHSAAVLTKRLAAAIGAENTAEKLHWALLAYRGARQGRDGDGLVHRSAAAFPLLRDWLPNGKHSGNIEPLAKLIADLSTKHFDEEIAEVEADLNTPRPKIRTRLSQLHILAATWRTHRRRISLAAVIDSDGTPQSCPEVAAEILESHWKPIFAEKTITAEAAVLLMPFIQQVPPGLKWIVDREGFHEVMAKPRDSAPGPDGIPFGAWRAAGVPLYDVMYEAFIAFSDGAPLPEQFNDCNLAFIPKGDNPTDQHLVARTPNTTRPISLSNADSKYFALALNRPLAEAATVMVHPRQRGFVNGRSLLDNVLEVEGFAQSFAIAEADDPAIILFDIMAAFPSLSHQWLFVVLAKMKVPRVIIAAFRALYRDCHATINLLGKRRRRFEILSGIRQGCPASGTLFALAMDPCIRFLIARIGPKYGIVNAYADDIAAVIRNLFDTLKLINFCFEVIGRATALHLHPGKVVVIPLWKFDESVVRKRIKGLVPRLALAKIEDCGKLLGFYVGPGADRLQFRGVVEELRARARYLASLNLSWSGVASLYRSHVLSTTCHILQLAPPTKELRQTESSILAVATKSPANAVPLAVLTRLKDFGLRTDFMSIDILGKAAAYRAMAGSAAYPRMMAEIARARKARDCNLSPYLREWTWRGALGHLTAVKRHVERIAGTPIETYGVQQWTAKALKAALPASTLDACIAKRLTTTMKRKTSPEAAALARSRIFAARDLVPACTVASMIRSLCNAWTTTGRFFGPTSACPFGCGALEADRFAHFPGCTSLRDLWQEVCPSAASFFQLFSLEFATLTAPMLSTNEVVQVIIWTDVVGQCLNEARASNPPLVIHGLAGKNMMIARLRFLGVQCDATRVAIRCMRSATF
jgi:endonuclease/exonuclease/phosphatase family metal-dependent hydrolase